MSMNILATTETNLPAGTVISLAALVANINEHRAAEDKAVLRKDSLKEKANKRFQNILEILEDGKAVPVMYFTKRQAMTLAMTESATVAERVMDYIEVLESQVKELTVAHLEVIQAQTLAEAQQVARNAITACLTLAKPQKRMTKIWDDSASITTNAKTFIDGMASNKSVSQDNRVNSLKSLHGLVDKKYMEQLLSQPKNGASIVLDHTSAKLLITEKERSLARYKANRK